MKRIGSRHVAGTFHVPSATRVATKYGDSKEVWESTLFAICVAMGCTSRTSKQASEASARTARAHFEFHRQTRPIPQR